MTLPGPSSEQKRQKNAKHKLNPNLKNEKSKIVPPPKKSKYKSEMLVKMTNKEFPESHPTLGK